MNGRPPPARPKLNLFAIPSQTTVLFTIIIVILGLPVLISASTRYYVILPLAPLMVLVFTLWDFLVSPQRQRRRLQMQPLAPQSATTAGDAIEIDDRVFIYINALAQESGLPQTPGLFAAQNDIASPFAFGTWRQRYLALPRWLVDILDRSVLAPESDDARFIEIVLRHEFAHFVNHDVWLTFFTRSLLKTIFWTLSALWLGLFGVLLFYLSLQRDAADWRWLAPPALAPLLPAAMQDFLSNPPLVDLFQFAFITTTFSAALLPLIFSAFFLWLSVWRRLLRVREYYSDARVASWRRAVPSIALVSGWLEQQRYFAAPGPPVPTGFRARLVAVRRTLMRNPLARVANLDLHPTLAERIQAFSEPHQVYGSPTRIGLGAAASVFLLYIVLGSLFSPVQRAIGSAPVLGFGFLIIVLSLLPGHLAALPSLRAILWRSSISVFWFMSIVSLPIFFLLLFISAAILTIPDIFEMAAEIVEALFPGELTAVGDDPTGFVVQLMRGAFITFFAGLPLMLLAGLLLHAALFRQMLTWYGAPFWRHSRAIFLALSLGTALFLWHGALPWLDLLAWPDTFEWESRPLRLAFAGLLAGIVSAIFWRLNRRYARLCPACDATVERSYHQGLRCSACDELLNPWLLASY